LTPGWSGRTGSGSAKIHAWLGEVHLKARSCDVLELDYDLAALELGAGTLQLQRLFALETAGYPCRDYAARLAGQSPNPAH
jgi:hypothetical protein